MVTFTKDSTGAYQASGLGEMGTWIDINTGLGYSGPKKNKDDTPANLSQVGNTPNLNQNPVASAPAPVAPNIIPQQNNQQQQNPAQNNSQTQDSQDPITKFNLAILEMLKNAQGLSGQEGALTNQRALERNSVNMGSDLSSVKDLRPADMVSALQNRANLQAPEQDAIAVAMKAQDARLTNFESMLGTLKDLGSDMVKLNPSPEIVTGYVNMLRNGADFTSVPTEIRNKIVSSMTDEDWNANKQAQAQIKASERAPQQGPTSYQEWSLAGGLSGTGKTYAEYLQTSKPPTQAEYTVAGYAQRVSQSSDIIDSLENTIADYNPISYAAQTSSWSPNQIKSADIQSLEQAERNFVNAVLRRESGAAIAPSEFDSAKLQYFPQPGDTVETLSQKKINRQTTLQSLINSAGSAYQETNLNSNSNNDQSIPAGTDGASYGHPGYVSDGTQWVEK